MELQYQNENDRAYGLAGMAISLAALDALDRVADVTLDSDGPMVNFCHSFYFSGNPSVSPKTAWDNMIKNFQITTAMVVSNLLSRSLVRLHQDVPDDVLQAVYGKVLEEGRESCSLEDDEIDRLYRNTLTYMRRIFNNRRLHPAIGDFVHTISVRRTLSGREIEDELHLLQLI